MPMTLQEIFDKSVGGVLAQKKPAMDSRYPISCRYRTKEGLACAVGQLMKELPEEEIDRIEGEKVTNIKVQKALEAAGVVLDERGKELLESLQEAHDDVAQSCKARLISGDFVEEFRSRAAWLGGLYGLDVSVTQRDH